MMSEVVKIFAATLKEIRASNGYCETMKQAGDAEKVGVAIQTRVRGCTNPIRRHKPSSLSQSCSETITFSQLPCYTRTAIANIPRKSHSCLRSGLLSAFLSI